MHDFIHFHPKMQIWGKCEGRTFYDTEKKPQGDSQTGNPPGD